MPEIRLEYNEQDPDATIVLVDAEEEGGEPPKE